MQTIIGSGSRAMHARYTVRSVPPVGAAADIETAVAAALSDLVAFPTESRAPNIDLIDVVADRLGALGARTTVVAGPEGRANLIASFGPAVTGGLLLSGHTDVVPAGGGWATDPYSVTKIGDALYGRGTADMKGFIACVLVALERMAPLELQCPLHVVLSFDEEIGCIGVRDAIEVLRDRADVRPDIVVIGEPTMMRPCRSHLGKLARRVVVRTTPAHSSLSHTKPSAISSAVRLLSILEEVQRNHRPGDDVEVTVNVGTISGGTAVNVIAAQCAFDFEVRFTVDHDPDSLLTPFSEAVASMRAELAGDGSIEVTEITRYPALRTEADDPWVRRVERIADNGRAGSISFGSEGGLFAAALRVPVVICGPGDIAVAHRADEYVTVEQLLRCQRFVGALVEDVCRTDVSVGSGQGE
jgi:acetylornithine deacetylase